MAGYPVAGDLDPLDSSHGDVEAEDTAVEVLPMPARPAEVDAVGRLKLLAAVAEAVLLRTFEELIG